ncbi:MAG: GNAT family N-acetyltransferase [Acidimicrobiales bacterium]
MSVDPVISTKRLLLVPLSEATIEALMVGDRDGARGVQDLAFTTDFVDALGYEFLKAKLSDMRRSGSTAGWFVRAVIRKSDAVILGDCGFHGVPEVVGRAEIGYRILPHYRGNGYASEAASCLVEWAHQRGAPAVFASVTATNRASIRVLEKVGFTPTDAPGVNGELEWFVFKIDS